MCNSSVTRSITPAAATVAGFEPLTDGIAVLPDAPLPRALRFGRFAGAIPRAAGYTVRNLPPTPRPRSPCRAHLRLPPRPRASTPSTGTATCAWPSPRSAPRRCTLGMTDPGRRTNTVSFPELRSARGRRRAWRPCSPGRSSRSTTRSAAPRPRRATRSRMSHLRYYRAMERGRLDADDPHQAANSSSTSPTARPTRPTRRSATS